MRRALVYSLAIGAVALAATVVLPASTASADVMSPPGVCTASGRWVTGGFTKATTQYRSSDVVVVPQKGTVDWEGHEMGKPIGYVGPSRPIDGKVQVEMPFGITVTVWHWGGDDSPHYSNRGQEKYSVPSALVGISMKLSGYESDSGKTVCSGSVYLEVAGSKAKNPVGWAAAVLTFIFLAGMLGAGFRKTRFAYDDLHP
jgi:hypothetical protein